MFDQMDLSRFGPNIIDMGSGYSITIPVIYQMPPFWWEDNPDAYSSVLKARRARGITVDDWDGGKRPVRGPETAFYDSQPPEWVSRYSRQSPKA
jgi:hypothetical protein